MLLGSLGLATVVASLLGRFLGAQDAGQTAGRIVLLVLGLTAVYLLSLNSWVDQRLSRVGVRLLRRFTDLEVHDYVGIPGKDTVTDPGDTVILYGRDDVFADLASRPEGAEGDRAHKRVSLHIRRALGSARRVASRTS
ncbi:MAG: hypothetical protein ABR540_02890 [Acidimicrobiales bacterium]